MTKKVDKMTWLEAAKQILINAKRPLHCSVIVKRIVKNGYRTNTGVFPASTLNNELRRVINNKKYSFKQVGKGVYDLKENNFRKQINIQPCKEDVPNIDQAVINTLMKGLSAKILSETVNIMEKYIKYVQDNFSTNIYQIFSKEANKCFVEKTLNILKNSSNQKAQV